MQKERESVGFPPLVRRDNHCRIPRPSLVRRVNLESCPRAGSVLLREEGHSAPTELRCTFDLDVRGIFSLRLYLEGELDNVGFHLGHCVADKKK